MRLEQRQTLIDDMVLVFMHQVHAALLDELGHPARIKVHAETNAAAMLCQVLHRQAQPARTGRSEH